MIFVSLPPLFQICFARSSDQNDSCKLQCRRKRNIEQWCMSWVKSPNEPPFANSCCFDGTLLFIPSIHNSAGLYHYRSRTECWRDAVPTCSIAHVVQNGSCVSVESVAGVLWCDTSRVQRSWWMRCLMHWMNNKNTKQCIHVRPTNRCGIWKMVIGASVPILNFPRSQCITFPAIPLGELKHQSPFFICHIDLLDAHGCIALCSSHSSCARRRIIIHCSVRV